MCNAAFWESKGMSEVFGAQPLPGVINLTHMVTATKWFSLSLSIIPFFFFHCHIYLHKPTCCLCMCNEYEFIKNIYSVYEYTTVALKFLMSICYYIQRDKITNDDSLA